MTESVRRLATVLFTDIVGSTARAAEMGDAPWREVLEAHDARVREQLERFHGEEVNTVGDGFVAAFADPEQALRCACAVRDAVAEIGLDVRCGVHAGEVQRAGRSVGGIAVHIAARLVERAAPGEVLVSQTVRDLVTGSGYGFADRGAQALKGVPGEWRLFGVTQEPVRVAAPGRWGRLRERLPRPSARTLMLAALGAALISGLSSLLLKQEEGSRRSGPAIADAEAAPLGIAVMPFSVTGSGLANLHEGMVDLLSTNLDGLGGLRTIDSRTVMARWREGVGKTASPDLARTLEIARRTGARYALVGSAVGIGSRTRLDVDVYGVATGAKMGTAQVGGSPDSLFTLVNRLSVQILQIVSGEESGARVDLESITTDSLKALRVYLEGEAAFRHSNFEEAIRDYRQAVEIDSTFALAFYRLGTALSWKQEFNQDTERYLAQAARRANRLSERDALLVRGALALNHGSLGGLAGLERATREYPDESEAWFWLGETYFHLGPQALVGPDASERAFSRVVRLDPGFTPAYLHLIESALAQHADSARVAELIARFVDLSGSGGAVRPMRLAFQLAFGDSLTRRHASAGLDSLSGEDRWVVAAYLWTPRYRDLHESVLRASLRAPGLDSLSTEILQTALAYSSLRRGQLRPALTALESSSFRPVALYTAYTMGLDPPPAQLARELVVRDADEPVGIGAFAAGAYAADRGAWDDHALALEGFRQASDRLLATGDSTDATIELGLEQALRGYALWRQGRPEEALRLLKPAQAQATGLRWGRAQSNALIRFWLGRLLLEMGRPAEAEPYLAARENELQYAWLWQDPLRELYLGRVYEALGRADEARRAYATFADGWADADAAVRPLMDEARQKAREVGSGGARRDTEHGATSGAPMTPDVSTKTLQRATDGKKSKPLAWR